MDILDILDKKSISVDLRASKKDEAIEELVALLMKGSLGIKPSQRKKFIEIVKEREKLGSTAIGQGIAIPHGKCNFINGMAAALGVSKKGIDFDSLDGEPVYIFFLLVAPQAEAGPHLKALAHLSRLLKDRFFRRKLTEAKNIEEVLSLFREAQAQA